ncbi:MAG: OmpH family outer membrane protein [Thiotrichaceae bacterium]|nr:OmpH family outer membrane protein [Thiotrichaceae bacterium]
MFNYKLLFGLTCLTFTLALIPFSFAEKKPTITVAVVDVAYLMEKIPQRQRAIRELYQRFGGREKQLDAKALAIAESAKAFKATKKNLAKKEIIAQERKLRERERAYNRELEDFRENLELARSEALDKVQTTVFQAIGSVREQESIDIIIQSYVAASKSVDITEKVLVFLNAKAEKIKAIEGNNKALLHQVQ